jgi:hypothetical protein
MTGQHSKCPVFKAKTSMALPDEIRKPINLENIPEPDLATKKSREK